MLNHNFHTKRAVFTWSDDDENEVEQSLLIAGDQQPQKRFRSDTSAGIAGIAGTDERISYVSRERDSIGSHHNCTSLSSFSSSSSESPDTLGFTDMRDDLGVQNTSPTVINGADIRFQLLQDNVKDSIVTSTQGLQHIMNSANLLDNHKNEISKTFNEQDVVIAQGSHHNLSKEAQSSIIFVTSWVLGHNSNMISLPAVNIDQDFGSFGNEHNFTRPIEGGSGIRVAPTYAMTMSLAEILAKGQLPSSNILMSTPPASVVDGCIVHLEKTCPNGTKFDPAPIQLTKISRELCLANVLSTSSNVIIVQGEMSCLDICALPRITKFTDDELCYGDVFSELDLSLLKKPTGDDVSDKSSAKWGLFYRDSTIFALIPSLTNLVQFNTHAGSLQIRRRIADSVCLMMHWIRCFAGLESKREHITGARLLEFVDGKEMDEYINVGYSSMSVGGKIGGLATVASHGPQMSKGGSAVLANASRTKEGSVPAMSNDNDKLLKRLYYESLNSKSTTKHKTKGCADFGTGGYNLSKRKNYKNIYARFCCNTCGYKFNVNIKNRRQFLNDFTGNFEPLLKGI